MLGNCCQYINNDVFYFPASSNSKPVPSSVQSIITQTDRSGQQQKLSQPVRLPHLSLYLRLTFSPRRMTLIRRFKITQKILQVALSYRGYFPVVCQELLQNKMLSTLETKSVSLQKERHPLWELLRQINRTIPGFCVASFHQRQFSISIVSVEAGPPKCQKFFLHLKAKSALRLIWMKLLCIAHFKSVCWFNFHSCRS